MKMFRLPKKRTVLTGLAATMMLALAAGAYAYFTSTGTGTGSATVGGSSALTLHGSVGGNLYPGGSQTVGFTVDNPSSASERVGTISLTSITPDSGHSTCSTTISGGNPDFTMPSVTVNHSFANGDAQAVTATGTLTMNETGSDQDACQGATLTLHLANN
jgi:hypothetical protein